MSEPAPPKKANMRQELLDVLEEAIAAARTLGIHQEHFKALREKSTQGDLIVGVIGITSSGKSAFLNALMGEREALLPEESRATTNLLVKCRRGPKREAILHYQTGKEVRLSGPDLNLARMATLCSEKLNPGNRNGIAFIQWTTPGSVIPEGLVLVDTPGLNAYGCEGHDELTLRRFLPTADIVIYMSSIRNSFKQGDLKGIKTVLENDQRVLFVLSQADLELDSNEGGKVWKSKEAKLQRHLECLQGDVQSITGLSSFGTVLVSSKRAKDGFEDPKSEAWMESGFETVIAYLKHFADELNHLYMAERFSRCIESALESAIRTGKKKVDEDSANLEQTSDSLEPDRSELLRKALQDIQADLETTLQKARAAFAPGRDGNHADREVRKVSTREQLRQCFNDEEAHWAELIDAMNETLDPLQKRIRETLKEFKIDHDRAGVAHQALVTSTPSSSAFVSTYEKKVRIRDWFADIYFWPKSETRTFEEIDHAAAIKALQAYASKQAQTARNHLDWWQTHVEQTYLRPLEQAKALEEEAEAESSRRMSLSRKQIEAIQSSVKVLEGLVEKMRLLREDAKKSIPGNPQPATPQRPEPLTKPPVPQNALAALRPILLATRESTFQSVFWKTLAVAAPGRAIRKVLLLGPRRAQHLRLLALLGHSLGHQEYLDNLPGNRWIVAGDGPAFEIPVPRCPVPSLRGSTLQGLTLVIAPEDEQLPSNLSWEEVMGWADVVAFELNAPRIAAGLAELHRAPYRAHLIGARNRLLFTCADGAILSDRLAEVQDVLQVARQTDFGPRPWFIYEDYEWRYTPLCRFLTQKNSGSIPGRELLRRWSKEERLAISPPFTREILESVFLTD